MANETMQRKEINDYFGDQYRKHAPRMGLRPEWLGNSFDVNGQAFCIEGLIPDEPSKSCVLVRSVVTGAAYKCSAIQVTTKMRGALLSAS